MEGLWSRGEEAAVLERTRCSAIGSPETVKRQVEALLKKTEADEIIATAQIYNHTARLRSFEIATDVLRGLVRQAPAPDRGAETAAR